MAEWDVEHNITHRIIRRGRGMSINSNMTEWGVEHDITCIIIRCWRVAFRCGARLYIVT